MHEIRTCKNNASRFCSIILDLREIGQLMDSTYYLDLSTLLKTLANVSAILIAELPDGFPGYVEPCKGYIRVHNNAIIMSAVTTNGGVIAEGIQALQLLQNNKRWHVSFSPDLIKKKKGLQQTSSLQPQLSQRPDLGSSQLPAKTDQRYYPTPIQHSPTTGPLSQPLALPVGPNYPPATGSLSQQDFFSTTEQSYSPPSTQPVMPSVAARSFILDSKVFQQLVPLSSLLMERYNPKERLIMRTVYSKINGQRRVDQLKEELRLPAATVERTLWELRRLGMID
jgi:hypothetical protein